jgi:hypothetical protein
MGRVARLVIREPWDMADIEAIDDAEVKAFVKTLAATMTDQSSLQRSTVIDSYLGT